MPLQIIAGKTEDEYEYRNASRIEAERLGIVLNDDARESVSSVVTSIERKAKRERSAGFFFNQFFGTLHLTLPTWSNLASPFHDQQLSTVINNNQISKLHVGAGHQQQFLRFFAPRPQLIHKKLQTLHFNTAEHPCLAKLYTNVKRRKAIHDSPGGTSPLQPFPWMVYRTPTIAAMSFTK